jgi:hypothetical protein
MEMKTELMSVERHDLDADCLVISLKVNVGMLNGTATSKVASQNRMAGERLFQWLTERVPRPVFEGFMSAANRKGFAG